MPSNVNDEAPVYVEEVYSLLKTAREKLCRVQVLLDDSDRKVIQGALDRIAIIEIDAGRGDHAATLREQVAEYPPCGYCGDKHPPRWCDR